MFNLINAKSMLKRMRFHNNQQILKKILITLNFIQKINIAIKFF